MNEQFQARPVNGDCARSAYPLVYLHDASVTLETWLRFVRRRCRIRSGQSGLMVIGDCRGISHALFSYRVDTDLRCRKRLCITDLIVAHLPGTRIDGVVKESAGKLAAALGCQTISVAQPLRPQFESRPSGHPWANQIGEADSVVTPQRCGP